MISPPEYIVNKHVSHLSSHKYYKQLLYLRDVVKRSSDNFWRVKKNSINVDLFMWTPSISSPMGPGSDSEALPVTIGQFNSYLVDSSQFGFEPILLNGIESVYCYLPSMRGEDPDSRHLNQFYHCEAEIIGTFEDIKGLVEEYVGDLIYQTYKNKGRYLDIFQEPSQFEKVYNLFQERDSFPVVLFENMVSTLEENDMSKFINYTEHGRDVLAEGEVEFMRLMNFETPIWIVGYDRDRVPFYQKPNPSNPNTVLNGDLLFPPLKDGSFGGEIVGAGQRQNLVSEMYESLNRQGIDSEKYEWYIDLRKSPHYQTTSGFGLGIERFLAWALALTDIKYTIPYPRLKNIKSIP